MNYYITVSDNKQILEKVIYDDRDRALYFAERRCKQCYTVTVKVIIIKNRRVKLWNLSKHSRKNLIREQSIR